MTESKETKKYHPSPAKDDHTTSRPHKSSGQTDGKNQDLSGIGRTSHTTDIIKEQKRTEEGYKKTSSKP